MPSTLTYYPGVTGPVVNPISYTIALSRVRTSTASEFNILLPVSTRIASSFQQGAPTIIQVPVNWNTLQQLQSPKDYPETRFLDYGTLVSKPVSFPLSFPMVLPAFTWNARHRVTSSTKRCTFNVLFRVPGSSLPPDGNLPGTKKITWETRASITGTEKQLLFNTLHRVSATRQSLYNAVHRVSATRSSRFNVLSRKTAKITAWFTAYALGDHLSIGKQSLFNTRKRLTLSHQATFNVRTRVRTSVTSQFNSIVLYFRSTVQAAQWNSRRTARYSRKALFNAYKQLIPGSSKTVTFNARHRVSPGSTRTSLFNATTRVSVTHTCKFNTLHRV